MANRRERTRERAERARRTEAERGRFLERARAQVEQARRALERAEQARKRAAAADLARLEREAQRRGFVGGVALGAVLGAAPALAFASRQAERTRALVGERAARVKARATDLAAKVRGDGEQAEHASEATAQGVPPP